LWGTIGTYGSFTPLMYQPLRAFCQQNQDSPFKLGVVTVIAAHSGPETAADARSHFGIFSPQVWRLFPRGQSINLHCADYNDVAPAYFAAVEVCLAKKNTSIIIVHVARPDLSVFDRTKFADTDLLASARGLYLIREFKAGQPPAGTVFVHGASSTANTVALIDRFDKEGINIRVVAVISEELFALQPKSYQQHIIPDSARLDCMFVTTSTKRFLPLPDLGPLTEEYTLCPDFDDEWRTGGSEADIIAESRLDPESVFKGIKRFAAERESRLSRQVNALQGLKQAKL